MGLHRGSSTSPPTLHPTPLPPTPSPSPTLSDASSVTPLHPAGCSAAPDALTNQKMLTIVVPVAVGTVVMVAVIVGVGVALCFCIIRNRDKRWFTSITVIANPNADGAFALSLNLQKKCL